MLDEPWLLLDDDAITSGLPGLFAKNTGLMAGFFPLAIGIDFFGTTLFFQIVKKHYSWKERLRIKKIIFS